MVNRKLLQEPVSFSKKSHLAQFLTKPTKILKYLAFTRISFLTKKGIPWHGKLFFNKEISGVFPDVVFSYIYLYGYSEEGLTTMVLNYLRPGMTFLDIGAHIGYYSMLASVVVGEKGKVYSFEPTPSTYKMLVSNVSELGNVVVNPYAAWSETEEINFLDYGPLYAACNSFTEARLSEKDLKKIKPKCLTVSAVSLDDYCQMMRVKPDFVKIDTESAEYQVLKGMEKTILKYKPIITIEIGDKNSPHTKGSKSNIAFLESLGYIPYEYLEGKIKKHSPKRDYSFVYDNILFLPK